MSCSKCGIWETLSVCYLSVRNLSPKEGYCISHVFPKGCSSLLDAMFTRRIKEENKQIDKQIRE